MAEKVVKAKCVKACIDSCPAVAAPKRESRRGKGKFQQWMKVCLKRVMEGGGGVKKAQNQKAAFTRCVEAWKKAKRKGTA
jgi:hypothetical protein